jgi:hypothetical protein
MMRINLLKPQLTRSAIVLRRVARAVPPAEKPGERVDRRVMRTVICGSCGQGENWRDRCQWCDGEIVRALPNVAITRRLARCHRATAKSMRSLGAARATAAAP